jgi:cytochrome c1
MWGHEIMGMGMRKLALAGAVALGLAGVAGAAWAAGEAEAPPKENWPQHGVFGTYDRGALQRGFQVYKEVCSACHGLKYVAYRSLEDLGYNEEQVKAIAAQYEVTDGPNDDGEMFQRPARPSDKFRAPFPNDQAARAANGGALPPDLSLIVKARPHGEDYIYALLTGYDHPVPEGHEVPEGKYYNPYFAGGNIAMPPPIVEDGVTYSDGTKATPQQMAHDVTSFLAWAAEPKLEARHRMGAVVMIFLAIFTTLLFLTYKRVWRDVH